MRRMKFVPAALCPGALCYCVRSRPPMARRLIQGRPGNESFVDEFMTRLACSPPRSDVLRGLQRLERRETGPTMLLAPARKTLARRMVQMVTAINQDNFRFRGRQMVTLLVVPSRNNSPESTTPALRRFTKPWPDNRRLTRPRPNAVAC